MRTFYEFFAGGGMAHAGLGDAWRCSFANDFDAMKARAYETNWGAGVLACADIRSIVRGRLPGTADLAWASFPCQDLSLAGQQRGLEGERSGCFWPFRDLMRDLRAEGRAPRTLVLENVYGALTSNRGEDFARICEGLATSGYRFGAMVIDAKLFVPQSRPRLFIVGVQKDLHVPQALLSCAPVAAWHPAALVQGDAKLTSAARHWRLWWNPPIPPERTHDLKDIIELAPTGVTWHSPDETSRLLAMMSESNRAKVDARRHADTMDVGTIYKRTRAETDGTKRQRAEIRFDGIAGCLRTPAGGSSRQIVMLTGRGQVRSRLISPREAARLMGLPETYRLPERYNDAYHLAGDGVVVPVVRFLAGHILEPVLDNVSCRPLAEAA